MIELTRYQCEVCGTLYDDAKSCQECEECHVLADKVSQYKYYPKDIGPESKYPYAVTVKMDDDTLLTFKR